jgi:hypothetical protein
VQSVWCGIRPLAKDPNAKNTEDAVRDHLVIAETNRMVTVTGGKWTTYRCACFVLALAFARQILRFFALLFAGRFKSSMNLEQELNLCMHATSSHVILF